MKPLSLFVLLLAFYAPCLTGQTPDELHQIAIVQREGGHLYAARQAFAAAKLKAQRSGDWDAFVENAVRESEVLAWMMKPDSARLVLQAAEASCADAFGERDPKIWRLKTFRLEIQQIDGKGDKALKESQGILDYWKDADKNTRYDLALAHLYIGKIRSDLGDFGGAAPELEAAVLILQDFKGDHGWELQDAYAFLGNVNIFLGRLDQANSYLDKADVLAQQMNPAPHFRTANLIRLRGTIPALQQKFAIALDYYNKALAQLEPYPEINNLRAMLYSNEALMYGKLNNFEKSIAAAKQSQALYEKGFGKRHIRLVKVFSNLGIAYETRKDYAQSYKYSRNALLCLAPEWNPKHDLDLPPPDAFNYTVLFLLKMTETGTYLEELYNLNKNTRYLEAAHKAYRWTIEAIDRMRNELTTEDAQFSFQSFPVLPQCYEYAIHAAWRLYGITKDEQYLQQALSYMEKRKSSILYASLQGRQLLQFGGIPASVLAEEKRLRNKLGETRRHLLEAQTQSGPEADNTRLRLKQARSEADAEYQAFLRTLERDYRDYYDIQYGSSTPDLNVIQKYLAKHNSTLIEYHLSTMVDTALYAVKISDTARRLFRLPVSAKMIPTITQWLADARDARKTIEMGNQEQYFRNFVEQSHQLYKSLLAPVLQGGDVNLVIVPADILYYLPFEMLCESALPPGIKGVNYSAVPWLLNTRTVRYAFSTALFIHEHAVADVTKELAGFAPTFSQFSESGTHRSMSRLRFANDEATAVAALMGGEAFLGSNANKETLRTAAATFQVLHIASHAVTEEEDPLLSYIALGDTARLCAYELYAWQIKSNMAVLSACNTGGGQLAGGEGVMSIARAFRYAGCPNLLVSLWQVDDESTRILMESFYRHLKSGESKPEALRHAKLEYLAAKHKTHPYFWAPFVLLGDDEPVVRQSSWLWWAIAGGIAGIALIGLVLRSRRPTA